MMSSDHPRVSVVVSSYNSGPFIDAAVGSVLDQTFRDLEVIAVDDGSTDDTLARLSCYTDDRLRIVQQPHQGPAVTANTGILLARGKYVGFLDGDDVWRQEKLARHIEFMDGHPSVSLTFSWSRVISESGRLMRLHSRHWYGPITAQQLFVDFVVTNNSATIVRREALSQVGGYDEQIPLFCDMDLYIRVALLQPSNAHAIPEELTLYRRRRGQASKNYEAMVQDWERLIDKVHSQTPEITLPVEHQARSNMSRFFAFLAYERREFLKGCKFLWKGFRCAPAKFFGDLRNWQLVAACGAGMVLPATWHRSLERLMRIGGLD